MLAPDEVACELVAETAPTKWKPSDSLCGASNRKPMELPCCWAGRDGRLSVAKYASVELRRGSRNQPADGRERRRASTRSRARCSRRSRPRSARAGSPSRMRSRTRAPTAGHLTRPGLFKRCPKVKEDIMNGAINAGRRRVPGRARFDRAETRGGDGHPRRSSGPNIPRKLTECIGSGAARG